MPLKFIIPSSFYPLLIRFLLLTTGILFSSETAPSTFLFCLKPELQPLETQLNRGVLEVSVEELNPLILKHKIIRIEPWLPGADAKDSWGEVYLNRIYRVVLSGNNDQFVHHALQDFGNTNAVLYAEPEFKRKLFYTPNDPSFSSQCSMEAMNIEKAWDFWNIPDEYPGDEKVLLASVDTGVDYTHPDLLENIWVNQGEIYSNEILISLLEDGQIDVNDDNKVSAIEIDQFMATQDDLNGDGKKNIRDALVSGSPFIDAADNEGNGYTDDIIGWDAAGTWGTGDSDHDPFPKVGASAGGDWSHGTHVAGILGAVTNNGIGMASPVFNGKILSVKCAVDGPDEDEPGIYNGFAGMQYAAKAGYNAGYRTIINSSWGGGGSSSSENAAINTFINTYGAVIFAAAGNGNEDTGDEEYAPHYPASYENVLSVCAIGCNGDWGNWATYHKTVDLAAPGESIYSTVMNGGYESWQGSSMASPNAASVAGLIWSYHPQLTNINIMQQIQVSADTAIYDANPDYRDCKGEDGENCLGSGMVDAHKAIGMGFLPYFIAEDYKFTEIIGDGDGVVNPGETGHLSISLENAVGWADGVNISVSLQSENDNIQFLRSTAEYGDISNGNTLFNTENTFKISVISDSPLGDIPLQLEILSGSVGDDQYRTKAEINLPVSLNQAGFPINTSKFRSSPLILDVDGDGLKEIIIGDQQFSGFFHLYETDGSEFSDARFPFETGAAIWASPFAADLDFDSKPEFGIASKAGKIFLFNEDKLLMEYETNLQLIGTPAVGNLDADAELEIVFSGYSTNNKLFVINGDGSDAAGFPILLDEKVKGGISLADLNGNGKDDIIFGTDNDHLYLIYDNGSIADNFPVSTGDRIQSAPLIIPFESSHLIISGCLNDTLYAVKSTGEIQFTVPTEGKIKSSPAYLTTQEGIGIFFGSEDEKLYAVDDKGNALGGWPIELNGSLSGSPVFADLDGDAEGEIIAVTDKSRIYAFNADGSSVEFFPVTANFPFYGAPAISDLDNDGDLEIIAASGGDITVIDVKNQGSVTGFWSQFQGGYERRGSTTLGGCTNSDYCNYNEDAIWNDGSCSNKAFTCSDGKLGCDCNGECNGISLKDCNGNCNGNAEIDICGECDGNGPATGFDCEGNPLAAEIPQLPLRFELQPVYPNPFNPIATITYQIELFGKTNLTIYDITGRKVKVLRNQFEAPGKYEISWNAEALAAGIYILYLQSGTFSQHQKLVLLK